MSMNTLLWILQGILFIKLLATGFSHAFQHTLDTMQEAINRLGGSAQPLLYLSAGLTWAAGLSLVLPVLVPRWGKVLPQAAAAVGALLVLSLIPHITARDQPKILVSLILLAMTAFLAYGRWVLAPL